MNALLAGVSPFWGWEWGELLIGIVIACAVIAVIYVALQEFGIIIPRWLIRVIQILAVAVVCVFVIRLLLTL